MKRITTILLICFLHIAAANAQHAVPRFGIYFSNPLSLLSKARIKFEYRFTPRDAFQFSLANYHAFCPGYQAALEYRNYHYRPSQKSERFLYGKLGTGYARVEDYDTRSHSSGPGNYNFIGGGMGRHFNLGREGHFFIDVAAGLKLVVASRAVDDIQNGFIFYTTGPGSFFDLNLHLGWQF